MMRKFVLFMCMMMSVAALDAQEREVAIVAHRGYWNCVQAGFAKNSVAALRMAQENGFWGSEFDVNISRDGKLLVFHDGNVNGRSIEKNPASAFAEERIKNGEPIPTIDDMLAQAQKSLSTVIVYELKPHSSARVENRAVRESITKLKEYGLFSPERVIFISFSRYICDRFADLAPGFTVQYLGSDVRPDALVKTGVNGIDTRYVDLLSKPKIYEAARNNGMSVNTWTVNKEKAIRNVIELGVDMITTDEPELVRRILSEMGIKERRMEITPR